MADGDDIEWGNSTLPYWPKGISLWGKVRCLLGYHLRETRQTGPLHKFPGMKLRDQCGRCKALL